MTIPAQIAGMMVSAIISDTLLFKSPTCTQEDIDAHALADIAEINLRIANFETADPLYYRAEPVGCTSTIIIKCLKKIT